MDIHYTCIEEVDVYNYCLFVGSTSMCTKLGYSKCSIIEVTNNHNSFFLYRIKSIFEFLSLNLMILPRIQRKFHYNLFGTLFKENSRQDC